MPSILNAHAKGILRALLNILSRLRAKQGACMLSPGHLPAMCLIWRRDLTQAVHLQEGLRATYLLQRKTAMDAGKSFNERVVSDEPLNRIKVPSCLKGDWAEQPLL